MARPETGRFPSPNAQNAPVREGQPLAGTGEPGAGMLRAAQAAWERAGGRQDDRMMAAVSAAGLGEAAVDAGLRLADVMSAYRAGRQRLDHSERLAAALAYVVAEIERAVQDS